MRNERDRRGPSLLQQVNNLSNLCQTSDENSIGTRDAYQPCFCQPADMKCQHRSVLTQRDARRWYVILNSKYVVALTRLCGNYSSGLLDVSTIRMIGLRQTRNISIGNDMLNH